MSESNKKPESDSDTESEKKKPVLPSTFGGLKALTAAQIISALFSNDVKGSACACGPCGPCGACACSPCY